MNFPKTEDVDFLEENQHGNRGSGLHRSGKCFHCGRFVAEETFVLRIEAIANWPFGDLRN
jgi:hypothetical protein